MVDKLTKDYWSNYFGDYGKLWVKDIPKRVKAAVDAKRTAAAGTAPIDAAGDVVPLGYEITAAALTLEGAYRTAAATQLFRATFNADGEITDFALRDV